MIRIFLRDFLEPLSYLVYAVVLFVASKKSGRSRLLILALFYLFITVMLFVAAYMNTVDLNNNYIYNSVYFITNAIISWYFYTLATTKKRRTIILIASLLSSMLFVIVHIGQSGFFSIFNGYANAIFVLAIIFYCLLYFRQALQNHPENLLLHLDFWLTSALLIYFLSTFAIFIYYESNDENSRGNLWAVQNLLLLLSALIVVYGYSYLNLRAKKQPGQVLPRNGDL